MPCFAVSSESATATKANGRVDNCSEHDIQRRAIQTSMTHHPTGQCATDCLFQWIIMLAHGASRHAVLFGAWPMKILCGSIKTDVG